MQKLREVNSENLRPGDVVIQKEDHRRRRVGMIQGVSASADKNPEGFRTIFPLLRTPENPAVFAPGEFPGDKPWTLAGPMSTAKIIETVKKELNEGKLIIPERGITSGCDPEIFVVDDKNQMIPAQRFLPSEEDAKKKSNRSPDFGVGGYQFWDGYQAEFCPTARGCLQEVHDNIQWNLSKLWMQAVKHHPGAKLTMRNTMEIPEELAKTAPDNEIRFRCSPSLNIYDDPGEPLPDPREYRMRFAGGHLHAGFGSKKLTVPLVEELVRGLDGMLGIAGVSLAEGFDTPERRKMYGRAGEFRLPEHGLEYRVLSNFWLCHPAISQLTFEWFRLAIRFAASGMYRHCWEANQDEVREVINSSNVKRAREILTANKHILTYLFGQVFKQGREVWTGTHPESGLGIRVVYGDRHLAKAVETLLNGVTVAVKDPENIHGNWFIEQGGPKTWWRFGGQGDGCWANLACLQ